MFSQRKIKTLVLMHLSQRKIKTLVPMCPLFVRSLKKENSVKISDFSPISLVTVYNMLGKVLSKRSRAILVDTISNLFF